MRRTEKEPKSRTVIHAELDALDYFFTCSVGTVKSNTVRMVRLPGWSWVPATRRSFSGCPLKQKTQDKAP